MRSLTRRALVLLIALCLSQMAMAQQAGSMSPSVVLVLKLVSSTHVKPTTGIVVSDSGLVVVPAEFASGQGEMIVLDGGTDIVSNGRPAKALEQGVTNDLAVLSVKGLKRPGITLSANALDAENRLHLEAFPPAELIAKGSPPLWIPINVLSGEQGLEVAVSPETPMPYVSGAIIDACGYLAGVSLSSGLQSLETDRAVPTLFTDGLKGKLNELEITLPISVCVPPVEQSEAPPEESNTVVEPAGITKAPDEVLETGEIEPADNQPPEVQVSETDTAPPQGSIDKSAPQAVVKSKESPSVWASVPLWLPLLGIIMLGFLIWKGLFFFRIRKNKPTENATAKKVQPASDEPVTAPLETGVDAEVIKPRSAPVIDFEIPELSERPEGCDGVLLIEGMLDADTDFKRFCFVNTEQVNITIGRGDADISIEHATISRAHARVESDGELMTLSDLDSRNGTFIDQVPCLAGEVLYFEADDKIFLGDVTLTIRVVRQEAEWA
ncbi:MAG: FHA domain-containing protein [Xanthomonadales bacterium]|nr:FHA domain-containing protein [Xanthomonadales bacterium]